MSERAQSDITKGIYVQVFDTLKQDTIVYESKKLAAKYLEKSDSTIGRHKKKITVF